MRINWSNLLCPGRSTTRKREQFTTEPDPALTGTGKRTLTEVYKEVMMAPYMQAVRGYTERVEQYRRDAERWPRIFGIADGSEESDENPQYDTTARDFMCTD